MITFISRISTADRLDFNNPDVQSYYLVRVQLSSQPPVEIGFPTIDHSTRFINTLYSLPQKEVVSYLEKFYLESVDPYKDVDNDDSTHNPEKK